MELKRIMALLDGDNEYNKSTQGVPQFRQEIATATFHQTVDEQSFLYTMLNANNNVSGFPEAPIAEDILWDGLWNLDEFHGNGGAVNFNANCSTAKANSLHNLVC